MDKTKVIEALKKAKESSKKRNFTQSFDLIVNLKDLDLKKPEHQADFFASLRYGTGKKAKICALVSPELEKEAREACDKVVLQEEFQSYAKDKKLVRKLAKDYDFFIAEAPLMPQIATFFGKVLGPKGKMPNPKAGCIVAPKTNLKPLYDKLQKTVRITAKTSPIIQCIVGKEDMPEEQTADNIITLYEQILHHLPNEEENIKSVLIKTTMGKPASL